jgi:excisionase family DNA binding protein
MSRKTRVAVDAHRQPRGQLIPLMEAADEFSVSVKTLRRRIADGTVHGYRIGRLIRVDRGELRSTLLVPIVSSR